MTIINTRKIAMDIVTAVLEGGAFSNKELNSAFQKYDIKDVDKALITEIVYGTIKYKYSIDKILSAYINYKFDKLDKQLLNLLRISLYQIKYLDRVPAFAVVNEAVNIAKKYISPSTAALTNGVLRTYLREPHRYNKDNEGKKEQLAYEFSFEPWFVELMIKQYGEASTKEILSFLNSTPSVSCRVNSIKSSTEEIMKKLSDIGYEVEEGIACPEAFYIIKGGSIEHNPMFIEGLFTVQDESAMLVAPSMDLEQNMSVLDLCCAPGGKTTHMAELMHNEGIIRAFDISKEKLEKVRDNCKRLGIENVELKPLNAEKHINSLVDSADRVLIDVPCSGFGIIKKKPEIKWNKTVNIASELISIQRNIMHNASTYVKEGGKLIYSTCTLNKQENEENVRWFLKTHSNYEIEPLQLGTAKNFCYSEEGCLTVLPNSYMDGFFIAKFVKVW